MLKKVVKNGTSLAVNIPSSEVRKQNLHAGDLVEIEIHKSNRPSEASIQEIDSTIDKYWDMLEYLKDK